MKTKDLDRPWLYPTHPEYQTFVQILAGYLLRGSTDAAYNVDMANQHMDVLERVRTSGGVVKEQVSPKQPRVQPTDDPNQVRTFFRTPDGIQYVIGAGGNLEINVGHNVSYNSRVVIQRADLKEVVENICYEFNLPFDKR